MAGYWTRHRLLLSLVMCVAVATIASMLFAFPCIERQANAYNSQSIYKNTEIDFVVPEPSFDQVNEFPGTNGIDKVFPFFMTRTQVITSSTSRATTILLSDQFQNIGITMYNPIRLIETSGAEFDNPILVDWQFCHDTGAKVGDTVSFAIGGNNVDFRIQSIYETNTLYDGGAILAELSTEQKDAIAQQSNNNGYSGMYISASDFGECQSYLTTDYRPMGRLKNPEQFNDAEQYQVHYNAIMSSGYANEITNFRIRESGLENTTSSVMIWVGAVLSAAIIILFNMLVARRGCEKVYFMKNCIPKGQDVKSYYMISFCFELIVSIVLYSVFLMASIKTANEYIPGSAIGAVVVIIPIAIFIAEIASLRMNYSMVTEITRVFEAEIQKSSEQKATDTSRDDAQEGTLQQ